MVACDGHDSPPLTAGQEKLLADPAVVLVVVRSKNANTVVYAARRQAQAHDRNIQPLDIFWRDFERAAGTGAAPREELTWIERSMAYGAVCTPVPISTSGPGGGNFSVCLTALPHLAPALSLSLSGGPDRPPRLTGHIGGRPCFLLRAYVATSENFLGYPTVHWTNLHGIDCATGQEIVEKWA